MLGQQFSSGVTVRIRKELKKENTNLNRSYVSLSVCVLGPHTNASSHDRNLNFSIHFSVVSCVSPAERKSKQMYRKIQVVTRRFRMRLHASNFGIQFLSRNIKVANS